MNMKTALRKLYKAITGEDNYKTNYSKLLVDIHKALTDKYPTNKNNHAKIISELADNWTGSGGGGGGGGGSSDFSTATVTVINETTFPATFYAPLATVWDDNYYVSDVIMDARKNRTTTGTIILYKGSAFAFLSEEEAEVMIASTSGDIEVDDKFCTITGDCTITLGVAE